jgi:hypothetical protein
MATSSFVALGIAPALHELSCRPLIERLVGGMFSTELPGASPVLGDQEEQDVGPGTCPTAA